MERTQKKRVKKARREMTVRISWISQKVMW
jgi:hypothetical protein